MTRFLAGIAMLVGSVCSAADSSLESIQPFRGEQNLKTTSYDIQLINLNSKVSAWYLLRVADVATKKTRTINLENARAPQISMKLNSSMALEFYKGATLVDSCPEFIKLVLSKEAAAYPYSPLCNNRVYVRNKANGYQTTTEKGTQFLRDNLGSLGEGIINAAKDTIYSDKYTEKATAVRDNSAQKGIETKALQAAALNPSEKGKLLTQHKLGIPLAAGYSSRALMVGEWYPTSAYGGVYVSMLAPGMVSPEILNSYKNRVNALQEREVTSLAYLVAFDMKKYTMGWAHGTNQPGIGWSDRLSPEQIAAFGGGAGPDGVGSFGELVNPGKVPPSDWARTIATFSGGFQLHHSHFERGTFHKVNKSTHYGFIEDGVIMAKPNPGLATIAVKIDGSFSLRVWTEKDNADIPQIRYLRQNGLPLIEPDESGAGIPGAFVSNRNEGNWSGSAQGDNYTPRGAACLIEKGGEQYFVYGYFSAATPSAIARVFQAYGCKVAIHLDMNSPGQAYLALVAATAQSVQPLHLMKDMSDVDPGKQLPRYFATPDFRDFFWVMKN